jgi:peroxiredoxin
MKPIRACATFLSKPQPGATSLRIAMIILTAGLLFCGRRLSAVGAGSQNAADTLLPANSRKTAPAFSLVSANGSPINLADYKGKVVLLDFWATWCGGCKLEIPWYMEFDKKYKQQGLAVIGVSMDEEGWKVVRPFLAQARDPETGGNTAMKYPVVIGNSALAKQYNLTSMPMTLLIDRQGRIALSHTGVVNRDDFESHIRQLLR